MDRPSFGTLLQRYRLAGGLTQQVLAELAGISVRAISDLERGIKAHPRRYTVRQLATALRLGAEDRAVFERAARGVSLADAPSAPATPLRAPLTPLIGREKDEAELVTLLRWQGARLLTVTGPGGVGKTRLAQQVAEDLRADFADGVLVISLAALREPRQVLSSVAAALGLRQHGSQATLGLLVAYLERRHMLVVLDNMEHLTGAAGDLVTILAACPDLQLLVTSRAPLRVRGEVIREVAPLELPSGGGRSARARRSPAVTLFCLCAGASQTGPTQTDPELEIATALQRFWVGHAHLQEGREWIRRGLRAGTDVPPRVRGGALSAASWLARIQEEFEEATLLATEALSLWRDLGDQKEIAGTLDALGDVALYGGNDSAAARPLYEESLALRRELRDEWALAMSLNGVGLVCLEQGEPVRAAELLEEGLAHARTAGDQRGVAILLTSMGLASLDRGDPETATTYLHGALGIFSRLGNDLDAGICLEELACVAHASGDHRRAAQLFGAADKVLGPLMSSARHGVLFRRGKGSVAATRAELGEGAFADSWEAGHALELEEAVTFALGANQRTTWIQ